MLDDMIFVIIEQRNGYDISIKHYLVIIQLMKHLSKDSSFFQIKIDIQKMNGQVACRKSNVFLLSV